MKPKETMYHGKLVTQDHNYSSRQKMRMINNREKAWGLKSNQIKSNQKTDLQRLVLQKNNIEHHYKGKTSTKIKNKISFYCSYSLT